MDRPLDRAFTAVPARLARLRWAAAGVLAVRALILGVGVGVAVFAAAAQAVGAATELPLAALAWLLITSVTAGAVGLALRPARRLRGGGVAGLLVSRDPWLASAARSAYELGHSDGSAGTSPELARAHAREVDVALAQVPVRAALPLGWIRHPSVYLAVGACALGAIGLGTSDRAMAGTYALLHPNARTSDGARFAEVVARTRGRLTFPAYMRRGSRDLQSADVVEAYPGTTVRYSIETRIPAREALLRVGDREVSLSADGPSAFTGRFVVRADAPLALRILDTEGRWLTDPGQRSVRALVDHPPTATLGPLEGADGVALDRPITLAYEAHDDIGLSEVTRVLRGADGREQRTVLRELEGEALVPAVEGSTSFTLADIGARPGDRVALYVETRDGDLVNGPHVGRSEERILVVDSASNRRARAVEALTDLLDIGLQALADRLEAPLPDDPREARARHERVEASTLGFAGALETHTEANRSESQLVSGRDRTVLHDIATRLRRLAVREATLYAAGLAPRPRRHATDTKLVDALEEAVLAIDDRVARARIEDAAELARELEGLRREMTSLLAELRRTESPEARQALLAALSRAQQRLQDLSARIAKLGSDVPSEFVNPDGLAEAARPDALSAMREAVERGDLAEAERQLLGLESQIDALASMLGNAENDFGEARFGPRDRALAEALDTLNGLEAEQRELARRSDEVRRSAAERAIEKATQGATASTDELVDQVRAARDRLARITPGPLGPMDEDTLRAARQRTIDAEDALRTDDLGEARRMARAAIEESDALARDLELSALMFPGRRGETADAARRARAAANELRALGVAIDRAIPRMEDYLATPERQRMASDASRQDRVAAAAEQLAHDFAASPDGAPLSEEAASALRDAQSEMRSAGRALRHADPVEAARAQEEAGRQLTELRESLERDASSRGGSGGTGGGGQGMLSSRDRRVEIPRAGAQRGPVDARRRILDAMGEGAPAGYEDAVRRYYEELLR